MAAGRYPEARTDLEGILAHVAQGVFQVPIAGTFPLAAAAAAHARLESRTVMGKLLLITTQGTA